ncbi:MAG: PAS domain S-box protein [Candidatus Thorarchaeota archaeon]
MMAELPWTSTIQVNSLFDLLDEGLVVLDNSGTIVHSNQAFADCLQYAAGDLVDRQFEDLVVEEQKGTLAVHLSDDRGQPLSLSIVAREGDQKHVSVRSLGLTEQGEAKGFCLVITSHSDHCSDFERIVSSAYLKMVTVDTDFNITYVNPAFREDPSEMLGTPVIDGVGPQYREKFREKLEASMKSETNQEFEFPEKSEGKPATWHVLRIAPIRDNEQIIGAVIAGYDITERVNAMRALQKSEEKFRGVFEHANDGITLADEQGKIVEINKAQENLFGIKREDVIGMPLWELQASMLAEREKTPETQKYLEDSVSSFFETGTAPWLERKTQGEFIHPLNGSQRFFEQTAFKIPTSKGSMLGSFTWDITEKKATEAALKRIERRHEQALLGADLGIWEWSVDPETGADIWFVNERFADIMGYSVEELQTQFLDWSSIIHPDDYADVRAQWKNHESGVTPYYSQEYRFKTKTGDWKWVLDRGMIIEKDSAGSATKGSGTFLDITERKESQAALDETRERYELAMKGADLGIWDWNAESDEMIFSDRWADILGYKVDDIEPNYEGWEKLVHPDDLEKMESKWAAHVDGDTDFYSNEHRMRTKTGEWKWVLERGKVVELNEKGGTKRATGTLLDITERIRTEHALREQESRVRRDRNLFRGLAEAAIHVKDTKELSRELLNSIVSTLNYDFGTFRIYNEQKNVLQYSALLGTEIKDTLDELPVTPEYSKEYIIVQTASTLSPIFISNLEEEEGASYLTRLRKLNASSAVAIPIIDDDQNLLGVFSLATRTPRSFTEGDKELLSTIANILGAVLERLKVEEALKESEQKFRRVFESIPVSMYLVRIEEDEDFTLVNANPAADTMFNLDHSEYIGKKMSEINMPYRADEIPDRFKEVAKTGVPWIFDHVVYHEDEIGLAMQVQVFRTSANTVVSSFLDITERMVQEKEIKRLNESLARRIEERTAELAAANKELASFAYSVSHDLRAPLRTVDGFSQALLEDYSDSLDDTGKDFLNRVRSAATHMGSLIEDFLELSRVTRAEMVRDQIDLSEIAQEIIAGLKEVESEREVEISISESIPARCDRRLMKLVVQNLMDNAWKFTSKTTDARIEFGKTEIDGESVFFVKDNGAGFNMEYSDKLFAPFQRLHPSDEFEGSGIGLATVQRIISRHGGRVWAESETGEGSTFYFTIPD